MPASCCVVGADRGRNGARTTRQCCSDCWGGKRRNHAASGPNFPVLTELSVATLTADTVDPWPLRFSGIGRPPSTSVKLGMRVVGLPAAHRPPGRQSLFNTDRKVASTTGQMPVLQSRPSGLQDCRSRRSTVPGPHPWSLAGTCRCRPHPSTPAHRKGCDAIQIRPFGLLVPR